MGEIGVVVFRLSEICIEIMPKSSRGPHTNSSALTEIAIFRKSQGATHEMGSASARGLPRNIYKRSGVDGERVQQYTSKVGRVSHLEHTSGTSHAVTQGQQPQLDRLHKAIDHWFLDGTLAARTAPRAATSSVALYRSSHTTGSYRDPHCSHCTSGSNELSGALS